MIKTFIFVEDGSVDLDELKGAVGDDVLVVPYRQGATPPQIQQPRKPILRHGDSSYNGLQNLMTVFDEMGFAPTTVCPNPEAYAVRWRDQVLKEVGALETENDALRNERESAVKDVAERIKMAFYYEFDELIPSTMADKIDEIVEEVLNEYEL